MKIGKQDRIIEIQPEPIAVPEPPPVPEPERAPQPDPVPIPQEPSRL